MALEQAHQMTALVQTTSLTDSALRASLAAYFPHPQLTKTSSPINFALQVTGIALSVMLACQTGFARTAPGAASATTRRRTTAVMAEQ